MSKKRILIVEDEESLLKLETILLTVKGYEVTGVTTGEAALDRLTDAGFDLVLLDVMLPDIDGLEVCRRIRQNAATAGIPIVMLSARKTPQEQEQGMASGADAYMTKPFKSAMIIEVIEDLVARKRS
jgi:twitching motility two-component system response regulator PilG